MRARSRATASASKLEQCGPAESKREREKRSRESNRSTLAEGRSHRIISEAGNVRGRKTRVEGGESSKARMRRKRTRSRKSEREINRDKRRRDPGGEGADKIEAGPREARERERESERRLED